MGEPPGSVHGRDGRERLRYRFQQSLVGARPRLANDALDLGERLFYGVQVWRVGGQEKHLGSPRLDQLPYPLGLVCSEVVEGHHLPLLERWSQEVLDVNL